MLLSLSLTPSVPNPSSHFASRCSDTGFGCPSPSCLILSCHFVRLNTGVSRHSCHWTPASYLTHFSRQRGVPAWVNMTWLGVISTALVTNQQHEQLHWTRTNWPHYGYNLSWFEYLTSISTDHRRLYHKQSVEGISFGSTGASLSQDQTPSNLMREALILCSNSQEESW